MLMPVAAAPGSARAVYVIVTVAPGASDGTVQTSVPSATVGSDTQAVVPLR